MRCWYLLIALLTLTSQLQGRSTKEIPRERSISLMLPIVKYQKRSGNQYSEFLNAGALSMNFCKDPTADILSSCHVIVSAKYENDDNYCFSPGIGVSWIDRITKLSLGFGISYDLFGKRKGSGIGIFEGPSWEDIGFLVVFYFAPSQSSFAASNTYARSGQEAERDGDPEKAFEFYLKAWKANPENGEAEEGIHQMLQTIGEPELYIKAAKQAIKLTRPDISQDFLDKAKEGSPTPQQMEEIEGLQKDIELKR